MMSSTEYAIQAACKSVARFFDQLNAILDVVNKLVLNDLEKK